MHAQIWRKPLNNNDHNQVFWARETEHPQQTIVLVGTWCILSFSGYLLHKII